MLKIEGKAHLVKHAATGAVINVDQDAFRVAKETKKRVLEAKRREEELLSRMSRLESLVEQLLKEKENGETDEH